MALGDFVVVFRWSKQMEEEEQGRREEVYLSERGWAVQTERWEEWEGRGGVPILFTLALFGLRMSWFSLFFLFWRGAREVFLWRNAQERSQTSVRIGAQCVWWW